MKSKNLYYTHVETPVGRLLLAGDGDVLHYLSFPSGKMAFGPQQTWTENKGAFRNARQQLEAYFAGELTRFDIPIHLAGTEFQNRTWRTLATIPFGQTRTYGWLAKAVGSPGASRAVGAANGVNPIPIILPCHRIIGANGALTGFGGGLPTKQFLLQLEGAIPEREQSDLFQAV